MQSEADVSTIERQPTSQALGSTSGSRRLLMLAQTDIWGLQEISAARRLVAWAALAITLAIALMLAMGY
jgi:hypothetical protein